MGGVPTWIFLVCATSLLSQYASASEPRVVCYYTNWSVYRPGTARFNPQNINPYLCTHLIYAFGGFTKDNTLKPFDKYQDIEKGGYAKFTGLKTYNNRLKTMLAIGGWNEGSSRFSPMVASRERRKEFVRNAIKFLRQNRFDGLDLDWEYPAFRDGGKPKDRDNYARLVRELREEFEREASKSGKPRLLLTMAVPAGIEYIQKGFDVKALNEHLDWMNLLSYDYHSAFEPAVNHHAPLYPLEEANEYSVDNELNIDYTIQYYLENGADPDKIVLGIPTYGRSYTLFNPDATELGAPADGPGEQGDATREKGYLAYYEICESLMDKPKKKKSVKEEDEEDSEEDEPEEEDLPWTVVQPNPSAMGPVAYRGNQWVGYDDIDIVKKKAEYVAEKGLGGIMFWSIDNDDFRGKCHGKPYPLIEAAKEAYISKLGVTDNAITNERQSSSSRHRSRPSTTASPATRRAAASAATPAWTNTTPEPPTTPDPGSDFKCTDEGFYPHPRDCKKYFWCLDSGPSNLGIVAHQFTCPSGLFFNKLADSCDFARNVPCKPAAASSTTTTARPSTTTNQPRTSTTSRPPAAATTTRRPNKLTSKSSVYFRTTTTTVRPVVGDDEVYEDEIIEDAEAADVDSEDPKVIKELIDLIKKAGGVEQLERHLKLSSGSDAPAAAAAAGTTTPLPIPKKLYQKVLDHARQAGKSNFLDRYNSVSRDASGQSGQNSGGSQTGQNSRRGPQNAGIESKPEASNSRRERPQYTTINRGRPATTSEEPSEQEQDQQAETAQRAEPEAQAQAAAPRTAQAPAKPMPQYVNIRRGRPTTQATLDQDDDVARNALFERNEATFVSTASEYPPSQPSSSRLHTPEYVTIRRSRPTTEEPTTAKYQTIEREKPVYEEVDEEEVPSDPTTTQYYTLQRSRGTTVAPHESLTSPAPTTVLAVQISSLLNSPVTTEPQPTIQTTESRASDLEPSVSPTSETEPPTMVTEPTTTTTLALSSTATPRRPILKRVRSTTTTTTSSPTSSAPQQSTTRRNFPRRNRPTAAALTRDPDSSEESTTGPSNATPEATTSKSRVRAGSKFDKKRAPGVKVTGGKIDPPAEGFRGKKRPSLSDDGAAQATGAARRPTRTYVRRRPGGGGANATSTAALDTTTTSKTPTEGTKRPFRVVGRRRTTASSTVAPATVATAPGAAATDAKDAPAAATTTATVEHAETHSQDLAVQESMEKESNDRPSEPKRAHIKKTVKIQRRPLTSRQPQAAVPATTTTTEEPKKREGKKYSASFKQNQLDEVIKSKSGEADESTEPLEELSVDTAIAIAAHQLLGAPLPSTPNYEDETDYSPSKKPPGASTKAFRASSTEAYTGYSNSKDYSARVNFPTGFTTLNPLSSIQSSTSHSTGFSSSSPTFSRGSTTSVSSSSPAYTQGSTIVEARNPLLYSRGSSSGSPVYTRGSSTYVPSLNRYLGTTNKYVSIPIDDFGYSTDSYTGGIGQEPVYFTREYLMESPQTRKFETDYQYLTTETPIRVPKRPTTLKRISTTVGPATQGISILPAVTPQPRRSPSKVKVYDKLPKNQITYRPVLNYDYYDDGDEKLLDRYSEASKVVVHENGNIECLDMGNFAHPASCRKFVSCARMESGALVGWQYVCPQGLSYDPVGGICNWSAGLGCNES